MTRATAVIAGAILFTLPFQMYGRGSSHHGGDAEPHADHEPRHGGLVVMVDDHHLEIVANGDRVEVYVTDALRRPVQPIGGSVVFDDAARAALTWSGYRLVANTPTPLAWGDYEVQLDGGSVLAIRVPAGK